MRSHYTIVTAIPINIMNYQLRTNTISVGRASVRSAAYSSGIKMSGNRTFRRIIGGPVTCKLENAPKKYYDAIQCTDPMSILVSNRFVEICVNNSVKGVAFEKVEFIDKNCKWDYHLLITTTFAEVDIHAYCHDNILLDEYGFIASIKDIFNKGEVRLVSNLHHSIFGMSNIITQHIFCTSDVAQLLESHNLTNLRINPH